MSLVPIETSVERLLIDGPLTLRRYTGAAGSWSSGLFRNGMDYNTLLTMPQHITDFCKRLTSICDYYGALLPPESSDLGRRKRRVWSAVKTLREIISLCNVNSNMVSSFEGGVTFSDLYTQLSTAAVRVDHRSIQEFEVWIQTIEDRVEEAMAIARMVEQNYHKRRNGEDDEEHRSKKASYADVTESEL